MADNDFYSQVCRPPLRCITSPDCCPLRTLPQRAHLVARGLPVCRASLASLPPFLPCPLGEGGSGGRPAAAVVNKTGLGSSAALTASLVAATLALLGAVRLPGGAAAAAAAPAAALEEEAGVRALVHAAAQVSHGLAQVRPMMGGQQGRPRCGP